MKMRLALPPSRPAIVRLFFARCPAAVFGRIWTIIVDAVQRQPRRRVAHVGIEIVERGPSSTNGYPPSPVVRKIRSRRIVASLFHAEPDIVNLGFTQAMCSRSLTDGRSATGAAAGPGVSASQIATVNLRMSAAIALAKPHRPVSPPRPLNDSHQFSESLARLNALYHGADVSRFGANLQPGQPK